MHLARRAVLRCCTLVLAALFAAPLVAAPPNAVQPPRPTRTPSGSGGSWPGLMGLLQASARGLSVVGVGYGSAAEERAARDAGLAPPPSSKAVRLPPEPATDDPLDARLRDIARQAGTESVPYAVLRAGRAVVVGPATCETVRPDLELLGPWDLAARGPRLDRFLDTLFEGEVGDLGREDGIAISDLSPSSRATLEAVLRPPLSIVDVTLKDPDAPARPTDLWGVFRRAYFPAPTDWSAARVRARLAVVSVAIAPAEVRPGALYLFTEPVRLREPTGLQFEARGTSVLDTSDSDVDFRAITEAPNALKPSDLTRAGGSNVTIGIRGIYMLGDLLAWIGARTGLKLAAQEAYRYEPVFIGVETIPCVDVLDALCLGLGATWRKLGDTYILAWERTGYGGVQQEVLERTYDAAQRLPLEIAHVRANSWRITLAGMLPFDPGSPFVPTPEQRRRMFGPLAPDAPPYAEQVAVRFPEMTSAQQEALRAAIRRAREIDDRFGSTPDRRPFPEVSEEKLRRIVVDRRAAVVVSVEVPGIGWVQCPERWYTAPVGGPETISPRPWRTEGPGLRPMPAQEPVRLEMPDRGIMVPPLRAERLKALATEMKARGLNVLFYPVLFGGYATLPETGFPMHPDLRGEDGLAAAARAMAPAGIRVVGYVETLAWRRGNDSRHWLSQHPDWLDVDVLGRPRTEWVAAHPAGLEPNAARDWVRVSEPAVTERLQCLVRTLAKRPELSGLAFLDWEPNPPPMGDLSSRSLTPPDLGFSVPDRLAALGTRGDPVDCAIYGTRFTPHSLRTSRVGERIGGLVGIAQPMDQPHERFIESLLPFAKEQRPAWKTYLFDANPLSHFGWRRTGRYQVPGADALVVSFPEAGRSLLVSMWAPDAPDARGPKGRTRGFPPLPNAPTRAKMDLMVLDFRAAPEAIPAILPYILPPDASARSDSGQSPL